MITSQYTVYVSLYNRKKKKYTSLSNTFNTIIEETGSLDLALKQAPILQYVEDLYQAYLTENGLTDADVNISKYRVETTDSSLRFYFQESDIKNTPWLRVSLANPIGFSWSKEPLDGGLYYSWPNFFQVKTKASHIVALASLPKAEILGDDEYRFRDIIVEIFDPSKNAVVFTSTSGGFGNTVESDLENNVPVVRRLRVYTANKAFLYETEDYTLTPQHFNVLPILDVPKFPLRTELQVPGWLVNERIPDFRSGTGDGNDLLIRKNYEDYTDIDYKLIIKLLGKYNQDYSVYDKVSFDYKGSCTYKQDYQVIDAKASFLGTCFQYGNAEIRLYKYDSEKIKVTYTLTAKLTYFGSDTPGGVKSWKTVDIKVPQNFTHDIAPYLYFNGSTVKIKETLWRGVEDPAGKPIKTVIEEVAKQKYALENVMYSLYDFSLEDVKVYGEAGDLYHEGSGGPLDVCLQLVNNAVDVNRPVRYYNKGLTVFEGEKFIRAEVDNKPRNVLEGEDFLFPIQSRYNNKLRSSSANLVISVYKKDSYVSATLDAQAKTCVCQSTRVYTINETTVVINEDRPAHLFDFSSYVPRNLDGPNKYNMSVTVKGKTGKVKEHYTGTILESPSDTVTMRLIGELSQGRIALEALPITKTRTITIYEPAEEYIFGTVNGDEESYDLPVQGKKNLSVQFRPFMVPSDGYNISYGVSLKNVVPADATVIPTIVPTVSAETHSFGLIFSSTHQGTSTKELSEVVQTYEYNEHLGSEKPQFGKYVIDAPVAPPKAYTSYSLAVDTDNAEARVIEYSKTAEFVLGKADVFTKVIPQKHPASPWKIKAQNGYYYTNQHERFFFADGEPSGPKIVVEGKTFYALTNNKVQLSPAPQQFSPIIVLDANGVQYEHVASSEADGLTIVDKATAQEGQREFSVSRLNIDEATLVVQVNEAPVVTYTLQETRLVLDAPLAQGDEVSIRYKVLHSFGILPAVDTVNACIITIHSEAPLDKAQIVYETKITDNCKPLDVSINPLHRLGKEGFIYLTEDEEVPHSIKLVSDALFAAQKDTIPIFALVQDKYGNPVTGKNVVFTLTGDGTLITKRLVTDENGVAEARLSATLVGSRTVTATCEGISAERKILTY